jgi:DNA-binding transcriptional LysR family regulator
MFVTVLDTGSFAAAAQRLGTSSGQASKLVSKLEAVLGVQLIKRTTRALSPTEVGQAYYQRMRALIEEFDGLDASVRNASGAPAGHLRLTAPMSFGTICLAPALLDFAQAFPEIHLDISFSDRVVNLVDEGFDVAVRIGKPSDSSLIARKLCNARIVVVAAPSYIVRKGEPVTPDELTAHECIIDTNFRDPFHWSFAAPSQTESATVAVAGRLHFSNGAACLTAAEAGMGIARVPSFIAGPFIRDGRVQPLFVAQEDVPLGVHALYPPARHLALKVRALVDFLAARFRGQPEWDRGW